MMWLMRKSWNFHLWGAVWVEAPPSALKHNLNWCCLLLLSHRDLPAVSMTFLCSSFPELQSQHSVRHNRWHEHLLQTSSWPWVVGRVLVWIRSLLGLLGLSGPSEGSSGSSPRTLQLHGISRACDLEDKFLEENRNQNKGEITELKRRAPELEELWCSDSTPFSSFELPVVLSASLQTHPMPNMNYESSCHVLCEELPKLLLSEAEKARCWSIYAKTALTRFQTKHSCNKGL